MHNPYENIDWDEVVQLNSSTHAHIDSQHQFENAYHNGLRHFAVCNYNQLNYPAQEIYNISNEILDNIIQAPATEFRPTKSVPEFVHIPSIGSMYEVDEPKSLYGGRWEALVDSLVANKLHDYVHILIGHPTRRIAPDVASLNTLIRFMIEFYDYHQPYTKGMEIYNESSDSENRTGAWSVELWDEILKTGRQIFAHTNPDHGTQSNRKWLGNNRILVDEGATESDCIRAYQEGNFYCSLLDTDLKFTKIEETNGTIEVELNNTAEIRFITENGIEKTEYSNTATFTQNNNVFVRIEVEKEIHEDEREPYMRNYNEIIFSQAIMYREYIVKKSSTPTRILLLSE